MEEKFLDWFLNAFENCMNKTLAHISKGDQVCRIEGRHTEEPGVNLLMAIEDMLKKGMPKREESKRRGGGLLAV